MPTPGQLRSRLIKKLSELFQLNQPDLDFGFYRIMHAKAREVLEFIDKDLLRTVADAFSTVDEARVAEKQRAYETAVQMALDYGAPDPEETPGVRKAKAALEAIRNNAASEADIYDHLYRFFERYYDDGDFISRRYYTRETAGKAAPFAVPYNGEEVKLHWANADQYYIKTAEYFTNFTFDLRQAREVRDSLGGLALEDGAAPLRVHFHVVEASEGGHGNVKEAEGNKRFFIIHAANPVMFNEAAELVVNFQYRPDPEKSGQENGWREKRNAEAVVTILRNLVTLSQAKDQQVIGAGEYLRLLRMPAPTENDPNRPLLARYINQFTARNTMDYFIHKDLGGFLRRELDFYIKNEVIRLDDIENADAPAVETYLAKVRVMRRIAGKLIDFLDQLEEFQKKLWLKKKFVVDTNYCITLDLIPASLYPEIATNNAQTEEWVRLFSIQDIKSDTINFTSAYTNPISLEFLQNNRKLLLDTRFFNDAFKHKLLEYIDDIDDRCDGLLIHSENFQAVNFLIDKHRRLLKCIYIDPPYNSDATPILYKNGYKKSSWISLMDDRIAMTRHLLSEDGVLVTAIDDEQQKELGCLLDSAFSGRILGTICVRSNPSGRPTQSGYSVSHEYLLFSGESSKSIIGRLPPTEEQMARFNRTDENGPFEWRNLRREGSNSDRSARRALYYPIYINGDLIHIPEMVWDDQNEHWIIIEKPKREEQVVYPDNDAGEEKTWRWEWKKVLSSLSDIAVRKDRSGKDYIYYKRRPNEDGVVSVSSWFDAKYSATEHGTALLKKLFGSNIFSYPKSIFAVSDAIYIAGANEKTAHVLDFFAGSGTTGHAVINLNRDDGGKRKYILVEMGAHFDTVLKPRISRVIYSSNWKDGKPISHTTGISQCIKYLSLESYEDTLNNLRMDDDPIRTHTLNANDSLKEDYMLHYLLDVETRGSQSLLNIDEFVDPTAYKLKVKKPGTDEVVTRPVDLFETFNYLIGLRVRTLAVPQTFQADFKRVPDPELPGDQRTKLRVDGKLRQDPAGPWWFRKVEGWVPQDPDNPNNGEREQILIVWRKLTGNLERDNAMLDAWFLKNRINSRDFEYATIYVNGSNNLPNLRQEGDTWKVRLTEEEFMKRMWEVEA